MQNDTKDIPTIGELMSEQRINGIRAIMIGMAAIMIGIGLIYTGIHNFNLFSRGLPADQRIFAAVPVILIEGSVVLFMAAQFTWFEGGAQKALASAFGWVLFGVVGANTLVDYLFQARETMPAWLGIYASLMLPVTPVVVVAMWKLVLDTDPSKRELDMRRTIKSALREAKYQAARRALGSDTSREALEHYGNAYASAVAGDIRRAAPDWQLMPAQPAAVLSKDGAAVGEVDGVKVSGAVVEASGVGQQEPRTPKNA